MKHEVEMDAFLPSLLVLCIFIETRHEVFSSKQFLFAGFVT